MMTQLAACSGIATALLVEALTNTKTVQDTEDIQLA